MDAIEVWRSLLCSYEFNSDKILSAAEGGRPRHQYARQKSPNTRTQHDIISRQRSAISSHPTQPPTDPIPQEAGDQAKDERKMKQRTPHRRELLRAGSNVGYNTDPGGTRRTIDHLSPGSTWKTPRGGTWITKGDGSGTR